LIPNHYPGGASAFQGSRYWVVNVYGNGGTYSTNLTFTYPSGELTAGSAANLSLYHRSGGSDGSWTSAVAVATSLTSMTVEFDGVTSFSQFAVSNNQMTYVSSTVTQDSDRVFFGSTSQEVIGIQVVMGGEVNPLNITQFDLSTSGTTSSSDISNARIYSTGTSSTFSTSTQYGSTVVSPSGSFSVTGSQSLTTGTNYFWLTYDVSGSAVPGDLIDGACTSMTIGGVSKTPSPTSPTGSRTVVGTDTIPGSALSFDGSGTYISIPNSSVLNPSTAVTIEAWVYPTATNNLRGIFYAGSSGYKLSIHNGALESEIWLDNGFGGQGSLLNGSSIPAFQWSHVAVTYEKNGSYDIYLNDSLVVTSSALSYNLLPSSSTMAIGVWYPGLATNVFSGAIDEVRIWGVARTKDEIREDMHTTLRGNESGLIAYFQFNEGSGSTTTSHVNSLVGTLGGGTGWQTSTVPVGGGTSAEQDGFTSGTASLGPVSLTTTNAFDNAVDLTATQINQSPNVLPGLSSHELSDRYWVVDATGTPGTFSTNLTFTVPASFTNNGAASAALYTLYHRNSTSDGSWTAVVSGATSISSTSVTFDGVTSFSQFTIGTNDPLPVQMSIVSAKVHENVVTLRWHASTEVDNAGFGVERRELSNPQSTNGSPQWLSLGFVEGAGTSTALKSYSFTDQSVPPGHYAYRLKQVDRSGAFTYSAEMTVEVGMAPRVFALAQNYPNPFNPTTAIEFTVPSDGRVVLKVYDMTGQEVTTLVDQDMKAGVHQRVSFDASKMASGIYFARLEYGGRQLLRKMILMK
jgi:hypothetical protein